MSNTKTLAMAVACLFSVGAMAQGFSDEGFPKDFRVAKHYTWDGANWKEDAKIYADSTTGNPPSVYRMDALMGGSYIPYQRFNITYNNDKNIIFMLSEQFSGSAWLPKSTDSLVWTGTTISSRIQKEYSGGMWLNKYRNTYTVDGSGKVTERLEEDWNGTAWQNDDDYFFHYDANGRLTDILDKDWQGSWVDRRRNLVNYSGNVETDVVKQELIGGTWTNKEKFEFMPSGTSGIRTNAPNSLKLYPNPARSQMVISGFSGTGVLTLRDLNGNEVMTRNITRDENMINTENLKPGLFIIELKADNTISREKFIKE